MLVQLLMIAPEDCTVPGGGSVAICMLAIARQMAKHHPVTIVCPANRIYAKSTCDGNLEIIRIPCEQSKDYMGTVLARLEGRSFSWIQVDNRPRFLAAVKAAYPDTPVSLFLHSLYFVPQKFRVNASLVLANRIIANSDSLKEQLIRRFPDVKHKVEVVHLGVDSKRFKPPSPAEKQQLRKAYELDHEFAVLFVGRVIPRKGLDVLIEAVGIVRKDLPYTKLMIVGHGDPSYMASLQALAEKNHVPVKFIGRVPHHKVHSLFGMADCFVCPSQKHEAFGLVNVEALASGLPVIASDIGGIKEIIRPWINGFLVGEFKEPGAFAQYILRAASDRNLTAALVRQGRADALRRFSWRRTAKQLISLYSPMEAGQSPSS